MDIIIKGTGGGKTLKLIEKSIETGDVIVCADDIEARKIYYFACLIIKGFSKEGLVNLKSGNIPYPITYYGFLHNDYCGKRVKGFLINNLDNLLSYISPYVPVKAITLTGDTKES